VAERIPPHGGFRRPSLSVYTLPKSCAKVYTSSWQREVHDFYKSAAISAVFLLLYRVFCTILPLLLACLQEFKFQV